MNTMMSITYYLLLLLLQLEPLRRFWVDAGTQDGINFTWGDGTPVEQDFIVNSQSGTPSDESSSDESSSHEACVVTHVSVNQHLKRSHCDSTNNRHALCQLY